MKILIISYLFAPNNEIGAIRPTKLSDFLSQHGNIVDVISYGYKGADGLEIPVNIRQHYMFKSTPIDSETKKSKNVISGKRNNVFIQSAKEHYRTLLELKRTKPFVDFCLNLYRNNLQKENYDLVFSSFGPIASLLCGLKIKKLNPDTKWICDFRDPILTDRTPLFFKPYFAALQNDACKTADRIVAVSNGYLKRICRGKYSNKSYVITNGYDRRDIPLIPKDLKNDVIEFTYAGTLYEGKRKITPLFRALRELIDEKKIDCRNIRFNYAGNDFPFLLMQAKKYGFESILVNHGRLSRKDCLSLQAKSDFLVLSTWNNKGEEGVFPGKFLEYMLFNKPIIALVDGNIADSEVAMVMREGNLGVVYEEKNSESDYAEMKKYFLNTFSEFYTTGKIEFLPSENVLNRYDYGNIVTKIEELIYG